MVSLADFMPQPTNSVVQEHLLDAAIRAALKARSHAYAPYSRFHVGCCLVDADGHLYAGCNVENASYGLTICAERTAVSVATLAGRRDITLCIIVTDADVPTAPCGACRQVLYECSADVTVISRTLDGRERRWQLRDLLPDAFDHTWLPEAE